MLPAEWAPQRLVQLTWPHPGTDWAPMLDEVYRCYIDMAREISAREPLLIVAQNPETVMDQLQEALPMESLMRISLLECNTNDTWARDHAFLTLDDGKLLDYRFNGWGGKFEATFDNQINQHVYDSGLLGAPEYENHLDFELEGGSIESDGEGTILTTVECNLNPNRRGDDCQRSVVEEQFQKDFGTKRTLWLHHGYLAGDDTDSHIDTLARFCSPDVIAYVQCSDAEDEHYAELAAMEQELKDFRKSDGSPYTLIPLPMASAIYDEEGERLPATYANFLIMNEAVLMPTYGQPSLDEEARKALATAFPTREIVGIDCRVLIRQHGSLHCCTMQYPE